MNDCQFFLQMSGVPGSGKTTTASAIGEATKAVIIDHDVTKSALLDADVPVEIAGRASYRVLQAVTKHLLQQRRSVIVDSPCFYEEVLLIGMALASDFGAKYLYVECQTRDLDEVDRRLRTRERHRSQLAGIRVPPTEGSGKTVMNDSIFLDRMNNMKRPERGYLLLDTSVSIQQYTADAVKYVLGQIQ